MSALRAARVEQKVVKVPKNEVGVTLGRSSAIVDSGIDRENDLAIYQHREKLDARKTVLSAEPSDLLRGRERGNCGRNLRIANFEQRGGAR